MLQDNRTYLNGESYIFVSCSIKDADSVSADIKWMISAGYKIKFNNFTDKDYYNSQAYNDIRNSKQFVVFLSDVFNNDKILKDQINYALANKIPITIVYIRNVTLNGYYDILFSSISSVEKYALNYNDYFHKLASVLDSECRDFVSQSPSGNKRKNFVVHINYEDSDKQPEDLEETKQIITEGFIEDHPSQIKDMKKPKKYLRPFLISVSSIVLIVIVVIGVIFIRSYLAQQNFTTGLQYYNGNLGHKDYKLAYQYFLKSADSGNISSMFYIGKMYQNGEEVEQDNTQAKKWYTTSAEKGNNFAEQYLGDMFYYGNGIAQNYSEAYKWYKKAAKQNNADAQEKLGEIYLRGYGVTKNYKEAANYFTLSTNKVNADAQFYLGYLYDNGFGVVKDYNKALGLYTKAANQNNASAMTNIGILYDNGRGVKQDYKQAFDWYTKGASKNNPDAECNLGNLYYMGHGVKQDNFLAVDWYVKACHDGSKDAPNKLKTMYVSGSHFSYKNLGDMYYYGWGVKKDLAKAKDWYQKAANGGDAYSKNMLIIGKFT
jgi:TPR repeat protein